MMKMMIISTGMQYLIQKKLHAGNFTPEPASASALKFFQPQP